MVKKLEWDHQMCFTLLQAQCRSGPCGESQQVYGLSVLGTGFTWQGSDRRGDPGEAEEDGKVAQFI